MSDNTCPELDLDLDALSEQHVPYVNPALVCSSCDAASMQIDECHVPALIAALRAERARADALEAKLRSVAIGLHVLQHGAWTFETCWACRSIRAVLQARSSNRD